MATVTFTGVVSAQATIGIVTITIAKPDGSTETLIISTLTDGSFSTTKEYTVAGDYTGQAHLDADAQYLAVDSSTIPFTISKQTRTLTLTINVS